MICYNSQVI